MDQILQNSISLFKETEGSTFQYTNEIGKEVFVFADKDQLLRVFNNLIKNALQAIPNHQEGQIIISLARESDFYIVRVEDNGSGIGTDVLDEIFTPNFTTKTTGMGLGLAMTKNIIEELSGKIWFKTEQEKGSVFYVSIPVYK